MRERLSIVLFVVALAFGLFAGAGSSFAWSPQSSASCHDQAAAAMLADQVPPMSECDMGMVHKACALHATGAALAASPPQPFWNLAPTSDWLARPSDALKGGRLPPETPPPIAFI